MTDKKSDGASDVEFRIYQRFDDSKAAKGVPHHIEDLNGNYYGTFTSSLVDPHNKYLEVAGERHRKANKDKPGYQGKHAMIYGYVQVCLHDWMDVLDKDGNQVPFSKEHAFKLLTHPANEWLQEELMERRAGDIRYYKAEPAASKGEDLGN